MIKITCEVTDMLQLSEMTEFQGGLKTRTQNDYDKILLSIYSNGIAFPFFVWKHKKKNYILDGHGRLGALMQASESGEIIPPLPVIYIKADNETQAKNLLLRLNSRYGVITLAGVRDFIGDIEIDPSDFMLPDLPDLVNQLNLAIIEEAKDRSDDNDKPVFALYCPECGEPYEITDDELRGLASEEN